MALMSIKPGCMYETGPGLSGRLGSMLLRNLVDTLDDSKCHELETLETTPSRPMANQLYHLYNNIITAYL